VRILALDIGGTHVKMMLSGQEELRRFDSGPTCTAAHVVEGVLRATRDWQYDVISIGCPAPIISGKPARNPPNLGPGWVGFDFGQEFEKPVKILNDAAMQAVGSYEGGCMLFLGLGTGLGSALIRDGMLAPLELGHLPYRKRRTFEDYVGAAGLDRLGKTKWRKVVADVVSRLRQATNADYVVLGGGNVKKIDVLPPYTRRGDNRNAFVGAFRLWHGLGANVAPADQQVPTKRQEDLA
jgi:polyphosphate glucokinase